MAHHDDLPYIVIERRSGAVLPFLWGALVGAAVALLAAPRSGRETQRELRLTVDRVGTAFRGRVDEMRDAVTDAVDGVRQRVHEQVDAVRETVEARGDEVRHAFDRGRRAAQDARQDLEQRVAEAKRREAEPTSPAGPSATTVHADVVVTEVIEERPPPSTLG